MKSVFKDLLNKLKGICNKYDTENEQIKLNLFIELKQVKFPISHLLEEYQNVLLFIVAHPSNKNILSLAENELYRLSIFLKNCRKENLSKLENTGLPYTKTLSTFSHDLLKWYKSENQIPVEIDSFYKSSVSLNDVLQFTLPLIEKEITTFEYKNNKLLDTLKVEKKESLSFILSEFDKLNEQPFVKDYLFNGLHLYVKLLPKNNTFSKAFNRISVTDHFYHDEIIKQFDQVELLNRKLPKQKNFTKNEFQQVVSVVKNSLTLLQRETDPVTYMDEKSFRLYELERGTSVAIYGMNVDRQLPLESYVGYTLFKNGLPAAYGGGWVFGNRSLFGINVFEPYRGGESGYTMCQLLRVYRQAFGVDYFEVEPYQYGLGNPEGISSGAYWFYFRFGFRSLNKELDQLSLKEFEKIKTQKGYRSSSETLSQFTKSNIALNMGNKTPLMIAEVREKVTQLISEKYKGNRAEAEKQIVKKFLLKIGKSKTINREEKKVLAEIAFFEEVMNFKSASKLKMLAKMVVSKPVDLYEYQKLLKELLN